MNNKIHSPLNASAWYAVAYSGGLDYFGPVEFSAGIFHADPRRPFSAKARRNLDRRVLCEVGAVIPVAGALLWLDRAPAVDSLGRLVVDEDGNMLTPPTHIATRFELDWGFCTIEAASIKKRRRA